MPRRAVGIERQSREWEAVCPICDHTEATAALNMATLTPALGDIATGRDDSAFSAIERLFVTINGPAREGNPQRQGLNSVLTDDLPPLHVVGDLPTVALDYSPLWDLNLGEWAQEAVDLGYRSRLIDEFQYLNSCATAGSPVPTSALRLHRHRCQLPDRRPVPLRIQICRAVADDGRWPTSRPAGGVDVCFDRAL